MNQKEYRRKLQKDPKYVEAENALKLNFELANAVLRARLKKGWSQTALAKAVGTKQANISRIEAGLANPTLALVNKIVRVLDLQISFSPSNKQKEDDTIFPSPKNFIFHYRLIPSEHNSGSDQSQEKPIYVSNWPVTSESQTSILKFNVASKEGES